jgi:hypothetical protein
MPKPRWTIALLILLTVLTGCRQQAQTTADNLTIDLRIDPDMPMVGDATLVITLTGADDQPVSDATVTARGDMSHAGMVPVIETVESGTDGVYELPFEWTMAGDWTVEVTVELANGETATQSFDLSVEGEAMNMDNMDMESTEEMDMDMDMAATPTMEMADEDAG